MHKRKRNIDEIRQDLLNYFARNTGRDRTTQSVIAEAINVNQGTISRYKNSGFKRCNDVLIKLCEYAGIDIYEPDEVSPEWEERLKTVVMESWDGSIDHAKKLERAIHLLGDISH